MYYKIKFRIDKTANSPESSIQIDADSLRDACKAVLDLYRSATIVSYQIPDEPEKAFHLSDANFMSRPISKKIGIG